MKNKVISFLGISCGIVVILLGYFLFVYSRPTFTVIDKDTAPAFILETVDYLNSRSRGELKTYQIYTAGFDGNNKIKHLPYANPNAILWIGGDMNILAEDLNNFGYVLVSTPFMKNALQKYYDGDIFVVPNALTSKELNSMRQTEEHEKYVAVIGKPPYAEEILTAKNIPYKVFTWEEADILTQKEFPFSMLIAGNWYDEKRNLDIPKVLLKALYNAVPIVGYWSGVDSVDPLYWFNDDANFYMFKHDAELLFDEIIAQSPLTEKRRQHGRKLFSTQFSIYSLANMVKNILNYHNLTGEFQAKPRTVRLEIPTMAGHYGAGDYWIARDIAEVLEKRGYSVDLTYINSAFYVPAETVFLIRGRNSYKDFFSKPEKSIYYQLYVGDKRDLNDYFNYFKLLNEVNDFVMTSSETLYKNMSALNQKISYLPQFTNTQRFFPDYHEELKSEVLFVGNYHFYREAAVTALKNKLPITIYGNFWPDGVAKSGYIDNRELHKYYSSAKIVLNDMLPAMKHAGFISNRIFDATASGALVVSEYMPEIEEVYGDSVVTFKTPKEMVDKIKYYLAHDEERKEKAAKARRITLEKFALDKLEWRFEDAVTKVLAD